MYIKNKVGLTLFNHACIPKANIDLIILTQNSNEKSEKYNIYRSLSVYMHVV